MRLRLRQSVVWVVAAMPVLALALRPMERPLPQIAGINHPAELVQNCQSRTLTDVEGRFMVVYNLADLYAHERRYPVGHVESTGNQVLGDYVFEDQLRQGIDSYFSLKFFPPYLFAKLGAKQHALLIENVNRCRREQ